MTNRSTFHRRIAGVATLALAAALATAGIALAAKQVKGATYVGHYKGASQVSLEAVYFKVSANGRKVIDLSVRTPVKCNGGCGGIGTPTGGTAKISRQGTFKVKLKIPAPGPGKGSGAKSEGTDTVTGTFHAHGKASGTVTSRFNSGSGGATSYWTATG